MLEDQIFPITNDIIFLQILNESYNGGNESRGKMVAGPNKIVQWQKTIQSTPNKSILGTNSDWMLVFDGYLMFASANEPNTKSDPSQMTVLMSYHLAFVNAVSASGGRNTFRTLVTRG